MKKVELVIITLILSILYTYTLDCQMAIGIDHPSGKIIQQERDFQGFDGVDFQSAGDLYIAQGDSDKVVIEADDNSINSVITFKNGTTLYINYNSGFFPTKLNIYVTMKNIKSIISEGFGKVFGKNMIISNTIFIDLGGAGNITIDSLQIKSIKIMLNGSGDVNIKGKGERCGITLNGSGNLYLSDFYTKGVDALVEGSGTAYVNSSDILWVRINGSGNIYYLNKPAQITKEINGTGKLLEFKK